MPVIRPIELRRPERDTPAQVLEAGRARFLVASTRGYCYGVDRALRIVDETLARFPDRRVVITSKILHNPSIHRSLEERGVRFLDREPELWAELGPADVALIPAFGVSPEQLERLRSTRALLVDTTCRSVVHVWRSVDRFVREGRTVVYHGRRDHEEAIATLGRLGGPTPTPERASPPHVILESAEEAERLAAVLEGKCDEAQLRDLPDAALSPGLDPQRDFRRVGFANQTTMLARESFEIAHRIEAALAARYPEDSPEERFQFQDTICSATDERQRALRELLKKSPDFCLVVGGFDSSNTSHLAEICVRAGVPAYHIEDASDLLDADTIRHRDASSGALLETAGWLEVPRPTVGVTSGASTPDASVLRVIERVTELAEPNG